MNGQNKLIGFRKNYSTVLLWVIFFFGISLRIYKLGDHNLWFDEFMSLMESGRVNFSKLIFYPQSHLYIVLLHFWTVCFGTSEFALRSLSMIFGMLSILLIYRLGKLFFDTKVGLASAFILSILPIHIWYSQEARAYSLLVFLSMLVVYFLSSAIKKNKLYLWIGFVVSTIISVYTNYFSSFIIVVTIALFFLRRYRYLLRQWVISFCFILAASLPLMPIFIKRLNLIRDSFWVPKPRLNSIATTFEVFNAGYNATPNIYFFTFMAFSLLFILGIQRWRNEKREELIWLISFLFVPLISVFLISQKIPIYLDRQLMLFSPFYYIIIAAGLTRIRLSAIKTAAYLSILVPIIFCLYNYFAYRMPLPKYHHIGVHVKKPVKPAADYIKKGFMKDDVVGYTPSGCINLFYYIFEKMVDREIAAFSFVIESKLDKYWQQYYRRQYFARQWKSKYLVMLEDEKSCKRFEEYSHKRLWLVYSSWSKDGILEPHEMAVRDWMRANYKLLDSKEFYGIFVDLYCLKVGLNIK